jgi:hypothetical protein
VTDRINVSALWVLGFAIVGFVALSTVATAQVPATVSLNWTLPTQNTDGSAIPSTGANALAKVEGWIATTAIPASPTTPATFTLTPAGVTTTQTVSVAAGSTVRARVRTCNNAGLCSVLTNEVTVVAPGQPGTITNVTIQITLT